LITAALRHTPPEESLHPGSFIPSMHQLIPAAIFGVSLVWFRKRLPHDNTAFDGAIYTAAWLNVAAQLCASQSERMLDPPFVIAQSFTVLSYTIALGGALLDNARLFAQVRHLSVSDPLTGLANYRRLLDVLESEAERTNRSARPFALLLLDLDGLKKINDTHGHLVGSRAICRTANILRIHCRSIDTAARYGGDEFALVLPETQEEEARRVANRIREVMAADPEQPPLSASIGVAIYRGSGQRTEKLISEADEKLYEEKARRGHRHQLQPQPRRRTRKA
jgi:diguanylate cyclase (GGDEF)-like protein